MSGTLDTLSYLNLTKIQQGRVRLEISAISTPLTVLIAKSSWKVFPERNKHSLYEGSVCFL